MLTDDQLDALKWRHRYLGFRIEAKQKAGGEFTYDQRERDALAAALAALTAKPELLPPGVYPPGVVDHGRHSAFSPEVRQATQERLDRAEKR